ncbi:MAG: class I SAM-dependent methyltransferase [Deltaproteobacteria bacterium]|nr:class I SAM-dependent methyltransferase [Deltaproteobacteria bacterium]
MLFQLMKMLLRSTPGVRRMATRLAYEAMSRFYRGHDVPFMDFGFAASEGDGTTLELAPEDEDDRYFIQLYHRVVAGAGGDATSGGCGRNGEAILGSLPSRQTSGGCGRNGEVILGSLLAGLEVLEVGCGRGGGAAWMARSLGPMRVVGMDISPSAVAHANRLHVARAGHQRSSLTNPGHSPSSATESGLPTDLSYLPGDAEAMPFPDGFFDVVVNVESSHCYGSMDRFLGEVARVLRPGGRLCFCDVRDRADAVRLRRDLEGNRHGLAVVELEDITANVLAALDRTSARKEAALARFPFWVRGMLLDQSGVIGGVVHTAFVRGERVYLRALLEKQRQGPSLPH